MIPDIVIHSSDSNPFYLDFWPLVSKVWKLRFNIEPLLVFIGDDATKIDETYGRVIRMKPIDGIPLYLQAQWVRFWIPSQYPDKTCLISDIDMFPISTNYFINQIASIPDSKYVHLNPYHNFIPVCYHVAKGALYKQVFELDDSWESSITKLHTMNMGHDCTKDDPNNPILPGKINWGADEEYTTRKIQAYPDKELFVFLNRHHKRLDRSHWKWNTENIASDMFADAHSIRPYSTYKHEIDRFVNVLLDTVTPKLLPRPVFNINLIR